MNSTRQPLGPGPARPRPPLVVLAGSALVAVAVVGLARAPRVGVPDPVEPPDLAPLPAAEEVVDAFLAAPTGAVMLDAAPTASDPPGLLGVGPAPGLAEFLGWSGVVYRIDRGVCSVETNDRDRRVVCPRARWSGPLLDGLVLAPVVQPATFVVRGATVSAVEGATAPALAAAFGDFCAWVHAERPDTAAVVFSAGCRPVLTEQAARALLVVLSGYAAGPR